MTFQPGKRPDFDAVDVRYDRGTIMTVGTKFQTGEAPRQEVIESHTVEQGVTRKFVAKHPRLTAALLGLPEMAAFRAPDPTREQLLALGSMTAADFFGVRESVHDAAATLTNVLKEHKDSAAIELEMQGWESTPPDAGTFSGDDRTELEYMYPRSVFVSTASEFLPSAPQPQTEAAAGHLAVQAATAS